MMLLLKIVAVLDVITNIMIPLGAIIHPDRTDNFKKIIRTSTVKLGLYKDIGYSIYINYIYELYNVLNSVMSTIKNIYHYLVKNPELPVDQIDEKIKDEIEKGAELNKKKGFFKSIVEFVSSIFDSNKSRTEDDSNKSRIEDLDDIISVDQDYLVQFITLLDEEHDRFSTYTCVLRFSDEAKEKINTHYAGSIQISDRDLTFSLEYPGGRYYKPIEVLNKSKLKIHGANADEEKAVALIAGCMTLADELIITQIGKIEFKKGIIKINLKKLKWLAFEKRNLWERGLDKILKRETENIDPDTIGFIIFESFNKLIKQGTR